jgi:TatD DNase family protein
MGLFDVHAHLTSRRFDDDVEEVIARAEAAGVSTIISNGLNIADNERVLQLAARATIVRPAIGYYPVDAVLPEMTEAGVEYPREDVDPHTAEETIAWVRDNAHKAVAIGEIGLDHHWVPEAFWARQEEIFRALVTVAMDADLPIIIHTRKAESRTFEVLQEMGVKRVNWHCFWSRLKLAKRIADAGHYVSVPANARRSETFTGLLRSLPRQQVLLETDCPYLSPEPGTRNEPANVTATCTYASELWETSLEQAQAQLEENFERLFHFSP